MMNKVLSTERKISNEMMNFFLCTKLFVLAIVFLDDFFFLAEVRKRGLRGFGRDDGA